MKYIVGFDLKEMDGIKFMYDENGGPPLVVKPKSLKIEKDRKTEDEKSR